MLRIDGKNTILYCNQAASSVLTEWNSKVGEHAPKQISQIVTDALASKKRIELEETFGTNTFSFLFVPVTSEGYVNVYANDVTERKKTETEREIMVEFLRIANATTGSHDLINGALDFFQKQCGCEAVGIRLKEGDEYPYYVTRGFPPERVQWRTRYVQETMRGTLSEIQKATRLSNACAEASYRENLTQAKDFFTQKGSFGPTTPHYSWQRQLLNHVEKLETAATAKAMSRLP